MKKSFQMSQLTVTCADVNAMLFQLNRFGIGLHYVCRIDELTVSFCVRQSQLRFATSFIQRIGGQLVNSVPASGYQLLRGILARPILILGIGMILLLTFFVPTRILFVTVTGNERITKRQIVEAASECGVYFGVARHELRSEAIKNQMLSSLSELKWVGVNTSGCVAHIAVRERALETEKNQAVVSSIIATTDGVIKEMTLIKGNPLCRVGQAVKKGDLLVSGYSDCGRCIYGTKAEAEIYAQTKRNLDIIVPTEGVGRACKKRTHKKYGLMIEKKRINFYKGSGILDTTCVRMYREYPLTLPGGFRLPLVLTVQEEITYDLVPLKSDEQAIEQNAKNFAQQYIVSQIIAGEVKQENYRIWKVDGALHLNGQFICKEMIGQSYSEEIVSKYGQTD